MTHPEYNDWPDDIKDYYDKTRNKIKKHGHVIQGTVDGKDALERPFAYTIGASFITGAELLCFFPIKGKGLSIITGIINRILDAVKEGNLTLDSQVLNNDHIYNLPIAMLVLEEEIKQDVESVWPRQLERDGFLAEFSTNDHKLILLICTDKNGNFPWDEKCESYWPQLCPPPLVAMAQEQLTGDDSLLCRLEENLSKEITNEMLEDGYTGQGTYTSADGDKYDGEYKDGEKCGQGTYTYASGDKYVGEFKDNERHGKGTFTHADGTVEKGLFEDGDFVPAEGDNEENIELTIVDLTEGYTGKGTMIWEDGKFEGSKYAGEWKDGKMHGQGTYTLADGDKYVGESKDDNFHGEGTYTYASGSKYVGEWKDGRQNGQGTYTFPNADEYVGECKGGNFNGQGTLTKADGTIQKGLFENGALVQAEEQKEDMSKEDAARIAVQKLIKRAVKVGDDYYTEVTDEMQDDGYTGKGCYFYGDRAKYVGEYKDGKMHGQGTYTYGAGAWEGATYVGELRDGVFYGQGTLTLPNGDKYVGEFKDDKRNGQGTYTFANGTIQEGLFENDKYIGEDIVEKENSKKTTEDTPIWEIIQHEFINLGKESIVKKEFSSIILSKYPHIKKGTLGAQISIQVINKRSRTNYAQCSKERVCGDDKFDFLFEQEDKTLCKYDKSKHGIWEIYKRDDGKLDVRIYSK